MSNDYLLWYTVDVLAIVHLTTTAVPSMALELSEGSDDDADNVKTASPAAVNNTLVPLMDKVSVDGE